MNSSTSFHRPRCRLSEPCATKTAILFWPIRVSAILRSAKGLTPPPSAEPFLKIPESNSSIAPRPRRQPSGPRSFPGPLLPKPGVPTFSNPLSMPLPLNTTKSKGHCSPPMTYSPCPNWWECSLESAYQNAAKPPACPSANGQSWYPHRERPKSFARLNPKQRQQRPKRPPIKLHHPASHPQATPAIQPKRTLPKCQCPSFHALPPMSKAAAKPRACFPFSARPFIPPSRFWARSCTSSTAAPSTTVCFAWSKQVPCGVLPSALP